MLQIYYKLIHLLFAALLILIQIFTFYKINRSVKIEPDQQELQKDLNAHQQLKTVIQIRNPNRKHSHLSKKSIVSHEEHLSSESHSQRKRVHGDQRKQTIQLPMVRESEEDKKSHQVRGGVRKGTTSILKSDPRQLRKTNTLLIMPSSTNSQLLTKRMNSMVETDRNLQAEENPLQKKEKEEVDFTLITFQIATRLLIQQGLLGWYIYLEIEYGLSGFITVVCALVFRFLQFKNRIDQILEILLIASFDLTSLIYLEIDEQWSYTYLVLIGVELVLNIIISFIQSKSKQLTKLLISEQ